MGLSALTAGAPGSIPDWGKLRSPKLCGVAKKKKKKNVLTSVPLIQYIISGYQEKIKYAPQNPTNVTIEAKYPNQI